ncbi:bifunctional lysylphosphatidylglycerol flippase/synthetase MprF [Mesorhizobium sp. 1B3]|uniref:bifunctional lysylphosphatidylglycerol flippase/synthetase MprF n=1 Tax=Mesorhizobium sp. 1B3 TaxID=3243599 RepID=UPI003D994199
MTETGLATDADRSEGTSEGGFWETYRARLFVVAALAVIVVSALALNSILADVSYEDLVHAIKATSFRDLALAVLFTVVSFSALSVYDRQALAFVGRKLPFGIVALTSFCAYAVGNIAGFGPLTGGTVRYRFYTPLGVTPEEVARIVGYVTFAFGIGLAFVAGLGLVTADAGLAASAGLPVASIRIAAYLVLALVLAIILFAAFGPRHLTLFSRRLALPSATAIVVQLLATVVDLAASAAVLWVLLPEGPVSYPFVLSVYSVAVGLGILSHVPGGVGVFEALVLAALGSHLPLGGVVGALLLYRVIYYVLPLVLAAIALSAVEFRRATAANAALRGAAHAAVPIVLAAFTAVIGTMLVVSGVTPTPDIVIGWLEALLPLPILEGAHFLASVIGLFMILAARGLVHRLDGAWWIAAALAAVSIPLALVKSVAIGEALLLAILFVSLLLTRGLFTRPASLIHDRLSAGWWLCVGTVLALALTILFFVYKEVDYSHELWWQFEFSATAPRSLRAALGIIIVAAGIAVSLLIRPPAGKPQRPNDEDLRNAIEIVGNQPVADANLVRMGDKSLLFSSDRRTFLMYGKRGRSWIALFGAIGAEENRHELVWRFVELSRAHGGRAVFYQVPAESLSMYADAGLYAFKLGEEARVDLKAFDLKGGRRASLRTALNRFERDGVTFEIVPTTDVPAIMEELQGVSNAWLAEHDVREKAFSLGAFDRGYVASQPVAVLRHGGRIVAFATVMTTGSKEEVTVDLMRFHPQAPNGSMEVLFGKLLLHFKDMGYCWFSLGMAPLAGLSENPVAPLWHKMGHAAYDHGEAFYNFHGLRAFKNKFDPIWSPRYMAVAGGLNPMLAIADVTVLISGGIRGVISK